MSQANDVQGSYRVVDENGRQRFLVSTTKPVGILDGQEYERHGREGTYVVYNDQNGSEKGGIVAGEDGATITLDYANADAIHLETDWSDTSGGARIFLNHMPDPGKHPAEVGRYRQAIELFCHTDEGAGLRICDSRGRPRIVLQVDASDQVGIRVLDADGNTVTDLTAT
jgi:hypothetical protein